MDDFFAKFQDPSLYLMAAPLAVSAFRGAEKLPAEAPLQRLAGEAQTQAQTLSAYQISGTLPAGLQSAVDQQFDAAKSALVSQYGHAGMGNSSMLVDKLNQLRQQKTAETVQFADTLAKRGIAYENLAGDEIGMLLKAQQSQDAALQNAMASFARGLAGWGGAVSNTTTSTS